MRSGVYWTNCCCNPDWETQVGGQRRATKEADLGECNSVPSLPGLDSFSLTYPALTCRALDCPVPFGTGPVASINLFGVEPRKTFQTLNLRRLQPLRFLLCWLKQPSAAETDPSWLLNVRPKGEFSRRFRRERFFWTSPARATPQTGRVYWMILEP